MKKYFKEIIIIILQVLLFYGLPLCASPTDVMGMILLLIIFTFILAIMMGILSKQKLKYLYPIIISISFIPSIYIYYNSSAWIHTLWYFIISFIGLCIGSVIALIGRRK